MSAWWRLLVYEPKHVAVQIIQCIKTVSYSRRLVSCLLTNTHTKYAKLKMWCSHDGGYGDFWDMTQCGLAVGSTLTVEAAGSADACTVPICTAWQPRTQQYSNDRVANPPSYTQLKQGKNSLKYYIRNRICFKILLKILLYLINHDYPERLSIPDI